jgi:DNA-binding NtrC family response regulator
MVDNEEYTVVVVDDEEMVTTSISTLFMLETDYNILTFNSPSEAVEELRAEEVDLVISDYLMPGEMNGVEFLLELKKLQPEAIRILLTAYADKENAIRAINDVGLYQYVEKPWDNDALLLLVRNGLRHGKLLKRLGAMTQELDIAKGSLERVQTEILKAFV